jgi:hypothetical protein
MNLPILPYHNGMRKQLIASGQFNDLIDASIWVIKNDVFI